MKLNRPRVIAIGTATVVVGAAAWGSIANAATPPPVTPQSTAASPTATTKAPAPTTSAASNPSPPAVVVTPAPSQPAPRTAASLDVVPQFVRDALDTRQAVGVTPADSAGIHALDGATLDRKSIADTARLHQYFTGPAFDDAKFGLDNGVAAERRGTVRVTQGGSRVLAITTSELTGTSATVTGLEEDSLKTGLRQPDKTWTETSAYSQSTFVAQLTFTETVGWRISSYTSQRTSRYPHN